jgi:hypothetical protein
MEMSLKRIADHPVTAQMEQPSWAASEWRDLTRVGTGTAAHATRFKAAYSPQGLYCLFDCEDRRLTCSGLPDNGDLFTEDVIELFLWPDERYPLYFEYEISPLGAQLPILVSNRDGSFYGWLPWHHEGARRCQAMTVARGGPRAPGAAVTGWTAEFFIPFALLTGVCPPPTAGQQWRANLYRIDYDTAPASQWAWETRTGANFHDYRSFGTVTFE